MNSWITSNRVRISLPCSELSFSGFQRRSAKSPWVEMISRSPTNALMTAIFTSMARGLWSTPESIPTPSWVKTSGNFFCPPLPFFDIANCDIKDLNSFGTNWNMKSAGNRFAFLRTCSLRRCVGTPYMAARSESSIIRFPRIRNIRLPISSAGARGFSFAIPVDTNEPSIWFPFN